MNVRTYRFTGHYVGDPQVYREKGEVNQSGRRRIRSSSCGPARHDREEFERVDGEVTAEVEACVEFAKAGTDPIPRTPSSGFTPDGSMEPARS